MIDKSLFRMSSASVNVIVWSASARSSAKGNIDIDLTWVFIFFECFESKLLPSERGHWSVYLYSTLQFAEAIVLMRNPPTHFICTKSFVKFVKTRAKLKNCKKQWKITGIKTVISIMLFL